MRHPKIILMVGVVFAASACSTESMKMTTFETLQNIGEIQCQKDLSADCSNRESYEGYKRKMEQLEEDE